VKTENFETPAENGAFVPVKNKVAKIMPKTAGQTSGVAVHGAGETQWWFDARGLHDRDLLTAVDRSNCTHVVINLEQQGDINSAKQRVVWIEHPEQLAQLKDGVWVFTSNDEVRAKAVAAGRKAGLYIDAHDLEADFPYCVSVCERGDDFVVINIQHATYIPYELLLAKTEGKPTIVLRSIPINGLRDVVDDIDQSLNAFSTMERGVGVLFRVRSIAAIESLSRNIAHRQGGSLQLVPARVVEVRHTGLGHRVCVDATSMMSPEEGMIVGSTGWGGIFVCSETHYLPHMNLREFRVNAGAVHSYIWGPSDNAMYLSEMQAGSEVTCVDLSGKSRVICVGRAKIERRPLLNIRCAVSLDHVTPEQRSAVEAALAAQRQVTPAGEKLSASDQECIHVNTFLQNDWHVRVMGADGQIRHGTMIKPGDDLLAHVDLPGRHTGLKVSEHILEK
jgi:3-dehydroquinate synthase class II